MEEPKNSDEAHFKDPCAMHSLVTSVRMPRAVRRSDYEGNGALKVTSGNEPLLTLPNNVGLAIAVRTVFTQNAWKVDDAVEATGLSKNVLHHLRTGKSVRVENLRKWAVVDGNTDVWMRLGLSDTSANASTNKTVVTDPRAREFAERFSLLPSRYQHTVRLMTEDLVRLVDQENALRQSFHILQKSVARSISKSNWTYMLHYNGGDAVGLVQTICGVLWENDATVLQTECFARNGRTSVFVRFEITPPTTDRHANVSPEALGRYIQRVAVRLVRKEFFQDVDRRRRPNSQMVYVEHEAGHSKHGLYGISAQVEKIGEATKHFLKTIFDAELNITDQRQLVDIRDPSITNIVMVCETVNPFEAIHDELACSRKADGLTKSLLQIRGVEICKVEYLGDLEVPIPTFLANPKPTRGRSGSGADGSKMKPRSNRNRK